MTVVLSYVAVQAEAWASPVEGSSPQKKLSGPSLPWNLQYVHVNFGPLISPGKCCKRLGRQMHGHASAKLRTRQASRSGLGIHGATFPCIT